MRWMFVMLMPMIVVSAVTPVAAGWHDLFTKPEEAASSLVKVAGLTVVETGATMASASAFAPSFIASISAVSLFLVSSDYLLVLIFGVRNAKEPVHFVLLFILSAVLLMGVPVWTGKYLFGPGKLTLERAATSWLWAPPILVTLYAYFTR